jgi:hypothetical protein
LSDPHSVVLLDNDGVRSIPGDGGGGGDGDGGGDGAGDGGGTHTQAESLAELFRRCQHCVFSGVSLSLPSAAALVASLAALQKTVYVVHSASTVYRCFLRYGGGGGESGAGAEAGVEVKAEVKAGVAEVSPQLYDMMEPLNKIHMIGDLKQHFTVMNWAIARLGTLRARLLLLHPLDEGKGPADLALPAGGEEAGEGAGEGAGGDDVADVLEGKCRTFRAFCMVSVCVVVSVCGVVRVCVWCATVLSACITLRSTAPHILLT